MFNFDINKLIRWLTITFLREIVWLKFARSLAFPVVWLYNKLIAYRDYTIYRLAHNGQVCYLRKVLNDKFDATLRRIYIDDGISKARTYVYTPAEDQPVYLGSVFLYAHNSIVYTGDYFRVIVPDDFDIDANRAAMTSIIESYKLASKKYTIEHE